MTYRQITYEERYMIARLRARKFKIARIAEILGRHRSTIYRELRRNQCNDQGYRSFKAQSRTKTRRSHSRRNLQFSKAQMQLVFELLRKQWSPEQIAGYLRRKRLLWISHETIYRYVWHDRSLGGDLWTQLRQARKKARKRYRGRDARGRLLNKRHISQRPISADNRSRFGHWEIDSVHGAHQNDRIVTLVERKSGFTIVGRLENATSAAMNQRVTQILQTSPELFRTITADNGTEFHRYKDIEKTTGVPWYFATPYHSWERPTNENTNGLLRQYLPKKKELGHLSQQALNGLARKLNSRPRKRHDYFTPDEVLHGN